LFPNNKDKMDITRLIILTLIWPFLVILVIIESKKFK